MVSGKLLAHDLAHEFLSYRGIHQPQVGSQSVVDKGLKAAGRFREGRAREVMSAGPNGNHLSKALRRG